MTRNDWVEFPSLCVRKTQLDVDLDAGETSARGKGGETQDYRSALETRMSAASGVAMESGTR